jgi:hypothetical protein
MKIKCRNPIFIFEKYSKNDNAIFFNIDLYNWGIGIDFRIGDSRRFLTIDLLCIHLELWF